VDKDSIIYYVKNTVDKVLKERFSVFMKEASSIHDVLKDFVEAPADYTLRGGKRLRAILILIGYWSRKWRLDIEPVKDVMASIEFLQSYLLVHDDIMDRDELRRGGPTLHIWFRDKCVNEKLVGDCIHYGISQAILAGDYLEALAIGSIASAPLPPERIRLLIERYSKGLRTVAYGQYIDVLLSYMPLRIATEEHVLKVHELKTASYTVELPLHLGAIAAGYIEKDFLDELTRFAKPAGIGFQLRDDIIGLYGDPSITGKPMGSDVREKKKTLLVIKAFKEANPSDKKFLEEIYDRRRPEEITEKDIRRVQEIVKDTGSLDYSEKMIKDMEERARSILAESKYLCSEAKEVLEKLLSKLLYRVK